MKNDDFIKDNPEIAGVMAVILEYLQSWLAPMDDGTVKSQTQDQYGVRCIVVTDWPPIIDRYRNGVKPDEIDAAIVALVALGKIRIRMIEEPATHAYYLAI